MPRIRTLKPEAPQHRKVGRLSLAARWLWTVMITQADDEGRLVADAGQLRITAFPYDQDVTDLDVARLLPEIARTGLIRLYQSDKGVPLAWFPSWRDHQRINRPSPSKLPPFHDSLSIQGALPQTPEPSLSPHAGSEGIGREGIKDGKGGEYEGREHTAGDVSPAPPPVTLSDFNSSHSLSPSSRAAIDAITTRHPHLPPPPDADHEAKKQAALLRFRTHTVQK